LLRTADKNMDGQVSAEEFANAHGEVDLSAWPREKRCAKAALTTCGEIKSSYKGECCGKDGETHSDTFDTKCAHVKAHYKHEECCGNPDKVGSIPL
jgi:hypothetical protein